ncbi:SDR family oxidoreductase [Paracoccus sediminicola]|uniref:SDR family oxidoreductase n=1 Tax=Paracoccus sediminicola TaxID=3017783 RepID=UPI0022F02799|nr:SDR family oxidoreductase [Paracoccus sediminicola]WBU56157.1 SDR family NAD(P)-dependent oxidoreductase [Paracoccus sediminicola]
MNVSGKLAVVTGAGGGIGLALGRRLVAEGARVVFSDRDEMALRDVAGIGRTEVVDVAEPGATEAMIDTVEGELGQIDLFCSNAGIMRRGGVEVPDQDWQHMWDVNVMAHVRAARHLIPRMAARGGGYLLHTASAAGLLSQVGSAPYAVTKHAAVGFAEWVALTHGDDGIRVSVLCPQAVNTDMVRGNESGVASLDGMLEPDAVADAALRGIAEERFLILPHPQVLDYMRNKTESYDRWIGGMRKLNRRFAKSKDG